MADLPNSAPNDSEAPAAAQLRRSPLAHLETALLAGTVPGPRGVAVREVPFAIMASIRVDPASSAASRLSAVIGSPLPARCGETTVAGQNTALWLGPDEWLVIAADNNDLVPNLTSALADDPGMVVDLSANRTTIELTGPSARAVLEKGCPVDLHPRSFAPGHAVSTLVGPIPVVLWQLDDQTYRLLPRASFADYLARWLLDAMSEYGADEVA